MNRPIGANGAFGTVSRGQPVASPALAWRRLEKTSIYLFGGTEGERGTRRAISADSAIRRRCVATSSCERQAAPATGITAVTAVTAMHDGNGDD